MAPKININSQLKKKILIQ